MSKNKNIKKGGNEQSKIDSFINYVDRDLYPADHNKRCLDIYGDQIYFGFRASDLQYIVEDDVLLENKLDNITFDKINKLKEAINKKIKEIDPSYTGMRSISMSNNPEHIERANRKDKLFELIEFLEYVHTKNSEYYDNYNESQGVNFSMKHFIMVLDNTMLHVYLRARTTNHALRVGQMFRIGLRSGGLEIPNVINQIGGNKKKNKTMKKKRIKSSRLNQ